MSGGNSFSTFDQLATETLFQIFDYLPYIDAINAFFSLNHRFNAVLLQYHGSLKTFTTPTHECPFWQTILSTIASQIEHLVITATEFSLSLDSFPNLKSLVISSSFPIDYDELALLFESEQFKKLKSLKIKSEIVKDFFDYRKVSFHEVLKEDNSLRVFESLTELGFSHRSMEYLKMNRNLRSLSLKCLNLWCLSTLLSCTPNLKYLNVVLNHFGPNDTVVNLANIHLKQCSMIIQSGVINAESFPLLIWFINQLSSSLIELSLDLHQTKVDESLYTGSILQQQLLEPMAHLKSLHLYLQLKDRPANVQSFLSTFQTPFWLDHHWTLVTHGLYLYTLPFHFETLYDFVGFEQIESSNSTGVLTVLPTFPRIKSIAFSDYVKLNSNLIEQLETSMPSLTSVILTPGLIHNLSEKAAEMNQMSRTLDWITTVHCPIECLQSMKDWLPHILPNMKLLMLSNMCALSTNSQDPMVVSQEFDAHLTDEKTMTNRLCFFKVECIEVKIILHEEKAVYLHIVHFVRELLEMFGCLPSITFHCYHLPRFPHIVPYTELDQTIELLNMGRFATKYRIKHLRHYIQFVRKNS